MSQGLSVQAQAALAQRLQAGGVNGMNGGMALPCCFHHGFAWLALLQTAFSMMCVTCPHLLER